MSKQVLVIGKTSQLGFSLNKVLNQSPPKDCVFNFVLREQLDLSSIESINDFFLNKSFDAIINFAAYTSVDDAEKKSEYADQINHLAVSQLANLAKNKDIPLIHISTDYVFDGKSKRPYKENDKTFPQNVYGLTKLNGEKKMITSGCRGAIIRTSWLYSEFGNNFVKKILYLSERNKNLDIVSDQISSPTYASNLAKVILQIFSNNNNFNYLKSQLNIYHFSDDGICSWYEFAKAIFEIKNIDCEVYPTESKYIHSIAKRPKFSLLNNSKIKKYLPELTYFHWRDSLQSFLKDLKV